MIQKTKTERKIRKRNKELEAFLQRPELKKGQIKRRLFLEQLRQLIYSPYKGTTEYAEHQKLVSRLSEMSKDEGSNPKRVVRIAITIGIVALLLMRTCNCSGNKCIEKGNFCGNGKVDIQEVTFCKEGKKYVNECDKSNEFYCPVDCSPLSKCDPKINSCGNAKIDEGETPENCPVDHLCGNGKVDRGEYKVERCQENGEKTKEKTFVDENNPNNPYYCEKDLPISGDDGILIYGPEKPTSSDENQSQYQGSAKQSLSRRLRMQERDQSGRNQCPGEVRSMLTMSFQEYLKKKCTEGWKRFIIELKEMTRRDTNEAKVTAIGEDGTEQELKSHPWVSAHSGNCSTQVGCEEL